MSSFPFFISWCCHGSKLGIPQTVINVSGVDCHRDCCQSSQKPLNATKVKKINYTSHFVCVTKTWHRRTNQLKCVFDAESNIKWMCDAVVVWDIWCVLKHLSFARNFRRIFGEWIPWRIIACHWKGIDLSMHSRSSHDNLLNFIPFKGNGRTFHFVFSTNRECVRKAWENPLIFLQFSILNKLFCEQSI